MAKKEAVDITKLDKDGLSKAMDEGRKIKYDPSFPPEICAMVEKWNEDVDKREKSKAELIQFMNDNKKQFGIKDNETVVDVRENPDTGQYEYLTDE